MLQYQKLQQQKINKFKYYKDTDIDKQNKKREEKSDADDNDDRLKKREMKRYLCY